MGRTPQFAEVEIQGAHDPAREIGLLRTIMVTRHDGRRLYGEAAT